MARTLTVRRTIDAPLDVVFQTVADISRFSQAVPAIVRVEFLSDVKQGAGARFRETRLMKGKEATEVLEVTEYVENDHVRIVCDSHGTVWTTLFTVRAEGGRTILTMAMEARAYRLMAKIMVPLIAGMIQKAIEGDMDAVKAFCEKRGQ